MYGNKILGIFRLQEAPIVNSVEKDYLNWNVSYPTIVLCPVRKIDDEILTNYVKYGFLIQITYLLFILFSQII